MPILSEEQLNNLNKDALVVIVSSLQSQLLTMSEQLNFLHSQLDSSNAQVSKL